MGIDNFAGGYLLAEHLLKLGNTRIHFVARPMSAPTVEARIAGVRDAKKLKTDSAFALGNLFGRLPLSRTPLLKGLAAQVKNSSK